MSIHIPISPSLCAAIVSSCCGSPPRRSRRIAPHESSNKTGRRPMLPYGPSVASRLRTGTFECLLEIVSEDEAVQVPQPAEAIHAACHAAHGSGELNGVDAPRFGDC